MKTRTSDEAGALAAAAPLAERVPLKFRNTERRQLVAGEIVAAFAEMMRGTPLPATHAGRRCVIDPRELFVWEIDDWLVARARSSFVASLRLELDAGRTAGW